jgi:hypothetical protein
MLQSIVKTSQADAVARLQSFMTRYVFALFHRRCVSHKRIDRFFVVAYFYISGSSCLSMRNGHMFLDIGWTQFCHIFQWQSTLSPF